MKFVILAVLLAFLIAFIVMVVKAANNWRWYHITSAVFAMLFAIILLFPTAGVLKSRQAWHQVKEKLEVQLESVEQENQRLQYGDPDDPTAGEGLRALSLELSKIGTEAGRTWRNLQMAGSDPSGQVTLRAAAPTAQPIPGQDPAAAAAPKEPLVPEGMVVYGFAEGKFPNLERPIPTVYLGEFKVSSSLPTSVTIVPTFPLERNQADAISSGKARSWSLYEMLPLDGHMPFIADGSKADDDNVLGRVDEKLVTMLLRNASPATLSNYLGDGKRGSPEEPAARWVKVRFNKKWTIDVDSEEQRGALEGGFYDSTGRAVDSRLQRSEEAGSISFAPGDTLVLKEEAAKNILADQEKVATQIDTYYLRPLNDYRYVLRHIRLQIKELDIRIKEMGYEKQVLETSTAATVSMLEKGQIEKLDLEEDLAQHQIENVALKSYFGQVREELRQAKESSSLLYRSNFDLLRRIERLSTASELTGT